MTTKETFDKTLKHRTYADVERMFYNGMISLDAWEYFVHRWVTGAFRFSTLGSGRCNYCKETH